MQDEVQVYQCKNCGVRFRNKRREHLKEEKDIWFDFVFKKQVHRELVEKYHLDKRQKKDSLIVRKICSTHQSSHTASPFCGSGCHLLPKAEKH